MADLQTINIGNVVNDGLGDDLRTAFQKVNANFADLNDELTVTVTNVGTSGFGLFKQKVGSNLEFKTLSEGTKIKLNSFTDTIQIESTAPDAFESINTDQGAISASAFPNISLRGDRDNINITSPSGSNTITVRSNIPVTKILTNYDFGPINPKYTNNIQMLMQASNIEFGTLTYEGRLDLDVGGILSASAAPSARSYYNVNPPALPVVTITSNVTSDNTLNTDEFGLTIPISGTVTGTMPNGASVVGQTVIVTVSGIEYNTTVTSNNTFTVNVPGSILAADPDRAVDARLVL